MMEDLMFVAALGALTIKLLTLIFGALAIAATFMLVKNMLEAGHSDFEAGERFALEEKTVGAAHPIKGRHADVIVIDDPHEGCGGAAGGGGPNSGIVVIEDWRTKQAWP